MISLITISGFNIFSIVEDANLKSKTRQEKQTAVGKQSKISTDIGISEFDGNETIQERVIKIEREIQNLQFQMKEELSKNLFEALVDIKIEIKRDMKRMFNSFNHKQLN